MTWRKIGNIYSPSTNAAYSHAMFPEVEILDESRGLLRIYYTHRGENNVGFPTYLNTELIGDQCKITYNHHEPIMEKADIGNFDDSGVNITSLINIDGKRRFYYYGWNLGVTVPFRNAIGVAEEVIGNEPLFLTRLFPGPIVDRAPMQPGLCATPCVIKLNDKFRMYFTQGTPWIIKEGKPHIACEIAYADSHDGIIWERSATAAVRNLPTDHVVTTPFVKVENGLFKMWYSFRGEKYRIGYAESTDGMTFIRKDEQAGITVSDEGWDSEMVCYPKVFTLNSVRYMIYCGNDYGRTGFGLAVYEND